MKSFLTKLIAVKHFPYPKVATYQMYLLPGFEQSFKIPCMSQTTRKYYKKLYHKKPRDSKLEISQDNVMHN